MGNLPPMKNITGFDMLDTDEIDLLFSRRNHLTPPLSTTQLANTVRHLRQQPMSYYSFWHKQPSFAWVSVTVMLAVSLFVFSLFGSSFNVPNPVQTATNRTFLTEQAAITPAAITPIPAVSGFVALTAAPAPALTQYKSVETGEFYSLNLKPQPQTLPPNR